MSGGGAPSLAIDGAADVRVVIIASQWHAELMDALVDGALRGTSDAGVTVDPVVVRVPGAFELPVAASRLALSGRFDAIVCLGLVIRGGTPHFEYVCQGVTVGCTQVAIDSGIPVGFGVLTVDNEQQARDRSGLPGSREDKGHEAAQAAIVTALTLRAFD
jgi:6,7-dimethyl-8-ribityllumazine synthase